MKKALFLSLAGGSKLTILYLKLWQGRLEVRGSKGSKLTILYLKPAVVSCSPRQACVLNLQYFI